MLINGTINAQKVSMIYNHYNTMTLIENKCIGQKVIEVWL